MDSMYSILEELCEADNADRGQIILKELKNMGLDTEVQNFFEYKNMIGRYRNGSPKEKIIFCAHYDKALFRRVKTSGVRTISQDVTRIPISSEGALDNGCSVVEILGALDELVKNPKDIDLTAIFFDAEEIGLKGSKYFVAQNTETFDGVYNIEVAGRGDTILIPKISGDLINSPTLIMRLEDVCNEQGIPYHKVIDLGRSDHCRFNETGIPAAVFTVLPAEEASIAGLGTLKEAYSPTVDIIHTDDDTIDKVDPQTLDMVRDYLLALAESYAGSK